jgi:hypothetical protein
VKKVSELLLQHKEAISDLTRRLADCPSVARYGPDEPETLAHAFSDLEQSMHKLLDVQLPKLADPAVRGKALENLLWDITTGEIRHTLYHLQDPQYFRILEPSHPSREKS